VSASAEQDSWSDKDRAIDLACDQFETAWRAGEPPRIEDFLDNATEPERGRLLRELVLLDRYHRRRRGEQRLLQQYQEQFPRLDLRGLDEEHEADSPRNLDDANGCAFPEQAAESLAASGPRTFGNYELLAEIARGGMGIVYKARQRVPGRIVALKMILLGPRASAADRERFRVEAEAAAALDHPNIVPIYDVGEHDGQPYFSMKFIAGPSLARWIAARRPHLAETLPEQRALAHLLEQAAHAVHHAHQRGILHRDLKPANILLSTSETTLPTIELNPPSLSIQHSALTAAKRKGSDPLKRKKTKGSDPFLLAALSTCIPQITDFGLAKRVGTSSEESADGGLTQSGMIVGTPSYMAPEQASGCNKRLTTAADIYSLGAILYELLTGQPPFKAGTPLDTLLQVLQREPAPPRRLRAGIARDLETICLKCLDKEPTKRYGSANELAEELRRFGAGEPLQARPIRLGERMWRWARRNPALASIAASTALALLGTLTLAIYFAFSQATTAERLKQRAEDLVQVNRNLEETSGRLRESVRVSVVMMLERAVNLTEQGEARIALLWLARALEVCRPEEAHLRAVLRANLAACAAQFHHLQSVVTRAHGSSILAAAMSRDGSCVLTGSKNGTARLWPVGRDEPLGPPLQHQGPVTAVAISPDGATLLTASEDRTARLWDARTGRPLGPPLPHQAAVRVVAFSPDGQLILTAGDENVARLWDAKRRRPQAELVHRAAIRAVAFSPDSRLAATAGDDNTARLWATATGKPLGLPLAHGKPVYDLAFSPDGRTLITCGMDDCARLWSTRTQQAIGRKLAHEGGVVRGAFSPDATVVATGSLDHTARLWDARTAQPLGPPLAHKGTVYGLDFSPDGSRLLTGSHDQTARLWDVATSRPLGAPWPHAGLVGFVAFRPDGRSATTGTLDETGRVWDLVGSECHIGPALRLNWWARAIAFAPEGDRVLAASTDNSIRTWHARTGQVAGPALELPNEPSHFSFRKDARAVLTGGNKVAQFLAIDGGTPLSPLLQHPDTVTAVALSPDSQRFLTGSEDRLARLWSAAGKLLGKPLSHPHPVQAVAFSPDGKTIATGCGTGAEPAGEARLWNSATGEPLGLPLVHAGAVRAVAFSPDGRLLATGCLDHTIRFWDVRSGRLRGGPLRHGARVEALAFRPDGQVLLSGSEDRTVRLWDVATGLPLGPALPQPGGVHSVAFDPSGQCVAAGSWDLVQLVRLPAPLPDEPARITAWAEVASGLALDEPGSIQVLDARAWQQRRRRLQELGGPFLHVPDAPDLLAWHERQAERHEANGRWFAALWHLDRLLAANPSSTALRQRRARAFVAQHRLERVLLAIP
jgi:WD40 repeat protein/serine/threonine protein kinase